jgi:hypothetical protein
MPISTIDNTGLAIPITTATINTIASNAATTLTLQGGTVTGQTIDTAGYVNLPTQPMISGRHTASDAVAAGGTIVSWTIDVNTVSANWNSGTATYTIPKAGKYMIGCSLLKNTGSATSGLNLYKNGSSYYRMFYCDGTAYVMGSGQIILSLAASDTLKFASEQATTWYGDAAGLGSFFITMIA